MHRTSGSGRYEPAGEGLQHARTCRPWEVGFHPCRSKSLGRFRDRFESRRKCRVELLVPLPPKSLRPHPAAKQIEAQVEIARICSVETEERHGGRAQALLRIPSAGDR